MEPVSALAAKELSKEIIEKEVLNECIIEEMKIDIEKNYLANRGDRLELTDYNPSSMDFKDKNNRYLLETIKSAEKNQEIRRSVLNSLENNSKLKGNMGEYFASKNLERLGRFDREVKIETNGRVNKIDFACTDGIKKNESFSALRISEDGRNIIEERIYIPKNRTLALEIKNGLSEINQRKHLKEQLEAGKNLCDNSFLGINKGMANEMINNPEKYITAINDLKSNADEIIVIMPDIDTQISKVGRMNLNEYNIS